MNKQLRINANNREPLSPRNILFLKLLYKKNIDGISKNK